MDPEVVVVVEGGVVVDILVSMGLDDLDIVVLDLDDESKADYNQERYEEYNDSGLFGHK